MLACLEFSDPCNQELTKNYRLLRKHGFGYLIDCGFQLQNEGFEGLSRYWSREEGKYARLYTEMLLYIARLRDLS